MLRRTRARGTGAPLVSSGASPEASAPTVSSPEERVKQSKALADTTFDKVAKRTGLHIDYLKLEAMLTKHVYDMLLPIVDRLGKIEVRLVQASTSLSSLERMVETRPSPPSSSSVTPSIGELRMAALSGSDQPTPTPRLKGRRQARSTIRKASATARRRSAASPAGARTRQAAGRKPREGDKLYSAVIAFLREGA